MTSGQIRVAGRLPSSAAYGLTLDADPNPPSAS